MSKRKIPDTLQDILEAGRRIREYTRGLTYDQFQKDHKTQDAVIRNLEIIGEATKNIPADFRAEHSSIPWKSMAGTRDRLIHDYFGINLDIVWDIIEVDLPGVIEEIDKIVK